MDNQKLIMQKCRVRATHSTGKFYRESANKKAVSTEGTAMKPDVE